MAQFWLATAAFVALGLTPVAVATVLNRRDARADPSARRKGASR
jgi:hypothetical protein